MNRKKLYVEIEAETKEGYEKIERWDGNEGKEGVSLGGGGGE
jgi:hypothetical protein